jgi:hypothetical protein
MTQHRFELSFAQIECARCGGHRIRGVACPDCGMAPAAWEIDVKLQRRRAVVAELLAAATSGTHEPDESNSFESALDLPSAIAPWLPDFLEALKDAEQSDFRRSDSLRAAVAQFDNLRAAANRSVTRRPFGRPYDASQKIISGLGSLIEEYLGAFAARTPLEAQERGEAGQRILDELADCAHELNAWLERRVAVDETDSVAESLAALLADASKRSETETLIDLAAHHQVRLAAVIGGPVDTGVAISYALQLTVADLFLEPVQYEAKLRDAIGLLGSAGDRLDVLFEDRDFHADLRRLELDVFDSALQCQHAVATATLSRQAAKAVVAFNKSLVEAAGRIVAAPLLLAVGAKSKTYAKLRHDNATELIRLVCDRPDIASLVAGLDPHLRTAEAHSAITYGEDSLTTDLANERRTYEYDALADATFEAVESCFAVMLGVRHAMAA